MNLYYENLDDYITRINKLSHNLIIAPSNIYLLEFKNKCKHKISSQDICYIEEGNYTSKVSWHQIKSIGINYTIIGHSEKIEDMEKTNLKLKTCIDNKIIPILCFDLNDNSTESIDKLTEGISSIKDVIFAYEPINNINNDNVNISKIKKEISLIYNYLYQKYNIKPKILYGGGINKENINEIYNIKELEGILIGSISSNIDEVENILLKVSEK